ncbi:MAG: isopeptide-forming domain-containing fimbrial protein [Cyanobacteria bacterium J06635_10]
MRRKTKRYQIYGSSWFRRIAATFLAGSVIQSPISTLAQKVPSPTISNQAAFSYRNKKTNQRYLRNTNQITVTPNYSTTETGYVDPFGPNSELVDPFGQILGCNNEELDDYTGFTVTLFNIDPNDPTQTEPGTEVDLSPTDDDPNNDIPQGIQPNITNTNNYPISNERVASVDGVERRGVYNFLFDAEKGQVDVGRIYILVINPPENSNFPERRIRLEITAFDADNNIISYVATAVDGQPITILDNNESAEQLSDSQISDRALVIQDAEREGLSLALRFNLGLCSTEQITITKTGDRATAEPGDTTIYRLSLRNTGDSGLNDVVVTDQFPLGFKFLPESVRGEIAGEEVTITSETNGSTVTFRTDATIPQEGGVLNIAYAATLNPDAVRGSGRNSATVTAERVDNDFAVQDGPATHLLKIRPGITSDCGTIIGRVFVDKNFDGEQQPGEPGVPNAVIFLENGNRITTDADGLYSVKNVLPGKHTGVLDLQSLPGYTLAPNVKFKERNSQSRLVNLEPGGMVRMNFAVTPSFAEEAKK